jgi:hypothetical protein
MGKRRSCELSFGVVLDRFLLLALVASTSVACSSDTKADPATTDAGTTPNTAGSTDAGAYGACTDGPPVEPSPSLTGRWALRTIASRYVPATGLTTAFNTRTVSTLLVDLTQNSTSVRLNAQYCEQHAEDPDALAHVVIPESYVRSLTAFERTGTYMKGTETADVLSLPSFVEVVGTELENPKQDTLPNDASDETVFDQDQDGNPGITIKLSGLVSGDLYVAQRQTSEMTGIALNRDRIDGHYGFTTEQTILASNPSTLKPLAEQTAIADPNLCASTFVLVRVESAANCANLLANDKLFD